MSSETAQNSQAASGRWIPLECNPEVLNSWANRAGLVSTESQFTDIYGFDEELLAMVPRPVKAILLLFPISDALEAKRREEDEKINDQQLDNVLWIKQTISNACGTIGLLHALANSNVSFTPESPLAQFVQACKAKTPQERAEFLEATPLFANIHADAASTGQSAVPTDLDTDLHFTCFVEININDEPHIVEFDGRRAGPFDRGACPTGDFLKDVASLVREVYVAQSSSIQFSMVSLGPPSDW
ncbi:ubiquitinyl hydrolase 1 [Paramarasmius palmivorus]|uniref:Ubiquitin carboxyl-terminal hydrolase n=1 Tax=Paramarasmius palmivorus TaxID=297713 RepID=A0AAW0DV91_9AGAR